jgi:alpha-D-ribose 1-methylphosphonate 5-triphosphate synthase subunit PhnI
VVRAHGVDLRDVLAERRGLVDDELQERVRRGLAREQLELAVDRVAPERDDADGDLRALSVRAARRAPARTMIAPIGSSHHRSLLPPADMSRPNELMNRSFRWSSHSTATWLDAVRSV